MNASTQSVLQSCQEQIEKVEELINQIANKKQEVLSLEQTSVHSYKTLASDKLPMSMGEITMRLGEVINFGFKVHLENGGSYEYKGRCFLDKDGMPKTACYDWFIATSPKGTVRYCQATTKKSDRIFEENRAELMAAASVFMSKNIEQVKDQLEAMRYNKKIHDRAKKLNEMASQLRAELSEKQKLVKMLQKQNMNLQQMKTSIEAI